MNEKTYTIFFPHMTEQDVMTLHGLLMMGPMNQAERFVAIIREQKMAQDNPQPQAPAQDTAAPQQ